MAFKIGFIGFGEAGQHIVKGLREAGGGDVAVWDIAFADEPAGHTLRAAADGLGLKPATGVAEALAGAEVVFSAVTTDQSLVAASQLAPYLEPDALYLDLNSTSPGKKRKVAEVIDGAGAHMIEAAVMDTVPPHGHKVPMLLAGEKAADAVTRLTPFGMRLEALDGGIGQASTIKMCRSVFMKGLPAILMECLVAAETAGATDAVLASIGKTYPGIDWQAIATRGLAGTSLHAGRRAGEMEEVAVTLRELGVAPFMAEATAQRLHLCADLGLRARAEARPQQTLSDFLDDVDAAATGGKPR